MADASSSSPGTSVSSPGASSPGGTTRPGSGAKARPAWIKPVAFGVGILLVVFIAYAAFVRYSNGTDVTLNVEVGTYAAGQAPAGGQAMFLRCANGSTPSVCNPGDTTFHVHKRDRVHVNVYNLDGGDHTHDIRLVGASYWLWPAGFENELTDCAGKTTPCAEVAFTAYATGTFEIICELAGHYDAGMHGTLVVS